MIIPMQIEFRNLDASPTVEEWIHKDAAKLERFFVRIMSCRVLVEVPHRHHRRGSAYLVKIDLTVPGHEIVVKHRTKPDQSLRTLGDVLKQSEAQATLHVAIHDAFRKAGRQLQDYLHRTRGEVKRRESLPAGAITRFLAENGLHREGVS
jgi:ribosome-associated translation inhibitor RaiA